MLLQNIVKSKAYDQSIQARKKLFGHMIVKNYLCNMKVFDENRKYVRRRMKQATQLTLLYILWQDNQIQPPKLLYKRTILKNIAISTGNTCIGVYCRASDQQKRPLHRCAREWRTCFPVNISRFLILLTHFEKHLICLLFNFSMVHSYMDLNYKI